MAIGIILVLFFLLLAAYAALRTPDPERDAARKAEGAEALAALKWGELREPMICPHCQTPGQVRTKPVRRKKGVSGAKATGAILTGGVSLLATGLSRKETHTQAHCMRCEATWEF